MPLLEWEHMRRSIPFLADFLGNLLTGMAAWSGASWGSGAGGWGVSALAMGWLHRSPPHTRVPKLRALARIVRASIIMIFSAVFAVYSTLLGCQAVRGRNFSRRKS